MTGSQLLKQGLNLAVKLVLARLLAPEDFGVVALAATFVSLAESFVLGGFVEAMVQREELDEETRNTAFWMHAGLGLAAAAVLAAIAPAAAAFFGTPELRPVLQALALTLIPTGLSPTYHARLTRDLKFRSLGIRLIVGIVAGGVVGIAGGLAGWGAWALVAMLLVKGVVSMIAFLMADPWLPKLRASRQSAASLWNFARFQLATYLLNFAQRNLDNVLVGGVLGVAALGVYSLAYQAVLLPLTYVTRPVVSVVFAALCNLPTPEARESAFVRTLEVLLAVTWPMSLLAAISVAPVLPEILGEKWASVVGVFSVLAFAPLFQSVKAAFHALAQSNGHPQYVLHLQVVTWALATLGFICGLPWEIEGVAWGYTIASTLTFPITLVYIARAGASKSRVLRVIGRASTTFVVTAALGFLARKLAAPHGVWMSSTVSAGVVVVAWLALSRPLLPEMWKVARLLVRRRTLRGAGT